MPRAMGNDEPGPILGRETLSVELPLPPLGVSPNPKRNHWRRKAAAARSYRDECFWAFRIERNARKFRVPAPPVTVHLDCYCGGRGTDDRYRPRDVDNLIAACKQVFDAMQDAGLVPTDGRKNVRLGGAVIHGSAKEHKGRAGLVVRLEWGQA